MRDEMLCPHCGQRMRYDFKTQGIRCVQCDHSPFEAQQAKVQSSPRPHVKINHTGEINRNAFSAFQSAHDYLHQGDQPRALEALRRAITFQQDFTDAHLWLARLIDDEKAKRNHLSIVLAYDPGNLEALCDLMVLNGEMTAEEAAQTLHSRDQEIRYVEEPVATRAEVLLCPTCGGHMTVHDESGTVECAFCGYSEPHQPRGVMAGGASLAKALLRRKAQPMRWVIGARLLHCNECAAERTIPARKLSTTCPFCGSTHVIQQDAIGSFEQPEGLLQFAIRKQDAWGRIDRELKSFRQRVANLFDNNRVKHVSMEGVYLPFWMFDVMSQITVTRRPKANTKIGYSRSHLPPTTTRYDFTDGLYDVPVCGVNQPAQELTDRLGRYDLGPLIPYEARLLARYPAQLYNIDFDAASLRARSIAGRQLQDKHSLVITGDDQTQVSISSMVKQMSFRLLLLPVWVATLIEQDGDTRSALVNGQTGQVVLGPSRKPE